MIFSHLVWGEVWRCKKKESVGHILLGMPYQFDKHMGKLIYLAQTKCDGIATITIIISKFTHES